MTIAAKISSDELRAQVSNRFVDKYIEARLIDATGVTYQPGITDDTNFLAAEVPAGTGGYRRQVIGYGIGDLSVYSDDGVSLSTKNTIFTHDGSGTTIDFSHVALVWSSGNVETATVTTAPTAGVDGTYNSIPIDSTDNAGAGLTVNLTIVNSGAAPGDYTLTVADVGFGFAPGDSCIINAGTLGGLGATDGLTGDLLFTVTPYTANADAGKIISVAQTTSSVNLADGNQAVFYWNLKQYGIASTNI